MRRPLHTKSSALALVWISTNYFFQIPQILSASGHDGIHVPHIISYLGFLLWHLWLSHPPRTRVNTCAQCVHLTDPCIKRKVLSLTKPKNKIYKTKSLRNYITRWRQQTKTKMVTRKRHQGDTKWQKNEVKKWAPSDRSKRDVIKTLIVRKLKRYL